LENNTSLGKYSLRFSYEQAAMDEGHRIVAGIDEAGRGPLAGPVVAAAVVVNDRNFLERMDDSKKMTARSRERSYKEIFEKCDVGVGMASVEEIDKFNILNATLLAMERAVAALKNNPDYLLIDGSRMNVKVPQKRTCLIAGESKSTSIACASIVAKVTRDRIMDEEDKKYPLYGFAKHKGYGTKAHIDAINKAGLSPIHRLSFGPFGGKNATAAF